MMRVYDLAKTLGMSSKELIDRLRRSGLQLKSHSSNVDEDQVRLLLTTAPPQKKGRPKPKSLETGPSVPATHAKLTESRSPRTAKADVPTTTTKISAGKPARSKLAETKAPSGAGPITEGTRPVGRVSPVAHEGSQKPK